MLTKTTKSAHQDESKGLCNGNCFDLCNSGKEVTNGGSLVQCLINDKDHCHPKEVPPTIKS